MRIEVFVTEKDGMIRVIQDNVLLESPLAAFRAADVFGGGIVGNCCTSKFF